jgi:ribosome biogenesis protein SSF1/2
LRQRYLVQDIADYITGNANATSHVDAASDSEPEDGNAAVVELAQNYAGWGNMSKSKSALKLVELGPCLSLALMKVEQGFEDGNVMFHADVHKTLEEPKAIQKKAEESMLLKKKRRDEQERNVKRKKTAKEETRDAKRQRKEEREKTALDELCNTEAGQESADDSDSDDDKIDEKEDLGVSEIEDNSEDEDEED